MSAVATETRKPPAQRRGDLTAAAGAAAQQNRLWQFVDAFYQRQGTENSGYVTDSFLGELGRTAKVKDGAALVTGNEALTERAGEEQPA